MKIKRDKVVVLPYEDFGVGAPLEWEDVYLPTRTDVTQRLLLAKATNTGDKAVVLFKGAEGTPITCQKEEGLKLNNNFLVRSSALFAEAGFMTAIVDAPSDKGYGMENCFRKSEAHQKDIAKVVDFLVSEGAREVFLIGTSRGTLSVAYLATEMTHPNIKGYVLTSTMNKVAVDLKRIKCPVLMVHHKCDKCRKTRYDCAWASYHKITNTPRKHFVTVKEGDEPRGRACGPLSAHGFLGVRERDGEGDYQVDEQRNAA